MKTFSKKRFFYAVLIIIMVSIYNGSYADVSVEELKKEFTNKHSKFIEIDEMQVHYRDEGRGFPIVLIHGTGSSLHTWNDWTKQLTKTNRVIRFNMGTDRYLP